MLLLTIHHIVCDGWSLSVLYRELFGMYEAFAADKPSPFSDLPIQYADFAIWQRRRIESGLLTDSVNYWSTHLKDLATLELPIDHPRPATQTFIGAIHRIHLPKALVRALKSLSRGEGVTLFMTCLAAFNVLLHRYSGQDDLVVGSPIAGRAREEVEGLIGFFVNMLVLRTDVSGDPTFRELLKRVRKTALEAYTHQDIPFEKLVEELHPGRDPSRNPLFQVVLALQNVPQIVPFLSDLRATEVHPGRSTIRFDLEVHLQETDDGLSANFIYNTALFDATTIARMTDHFRMILDGVIANPEQQLSRLPLLTGEEWRQLLVDWNNTATSYPRDASIHDLFAVQADATPDALAVAYGEERLTYRQLDERSNQVAHQLRALGVTSEVIVGVCMERSAEMIVSFLAILKAGGAYLPIEASYPRDRLTFMLKDAAAPVLLTQEKFRANFIETAARVVCLNGQTFLDPNRHCPGKIATAASLAYVIYTSGTTGQPKGVAVSHRAIIRLVRNTDYVQLSPADRMAQASTASFDAATFEIWGALLNGAALIVIPQSISLSPNDLARELRGQKISTLFLTTALFNQIANANPTAFQSLRYLLIGGETCDPKCVHKVLQLGAPQQLLNVYGPTECTTFAIAHTVECVQDSAESVPIGRPISNTRAYVLDRYQQPVPVGVIGELYIGGDGLAREYLNRADLTVERFVFDRFSDDPTSRLYRTGDFARYLPDGAIDFVGRKDGQVKIRGFRIELQEIEAALSQHPDIDQSAVIAKRMHAGEQRLIAYVVSSHPERISHRELRKFLGERLPDFMLPAAFVSLSSLPLTSNGKLDRGALPDPKKGGPDDGRKLAEPRTKVEEGLAEIWSKLLGIQRVGIHDNFFELGGHSLLAIQLVARIEKRFGKPLPVAVLFQSPTIEEMANLLTEERSPELWSSLIHIQPQGRRTPFFWVHGDFSNILLPVYLGWDQPLYGIEHQGHDGRPALHTTVDRIATHYMTEVRRIRPHGPYLLGGYSFGAVVAFEMAQQLKKAGEDVAFLFMLDPPGRLRVKQPSPSLSEDFRLHGRRLKQLAPAQKLHYLLSGLKSVLWDPSAGKIKKRFQKLNWKVHLAFGSLVPPSLRSRYILDIYAEALASYVPHEYSGRVTLFKSKGGPYRPPLHWDALISGEFDVHEGIGNHMELRSEPYVRQWAEILGSALERAE